MTKLISETVFKKRVLKDLESLDQIYILKTQERSRRGVPDILACFKGWFFAIELKRDGLKADALQEHTLERIRQAEGFAICTTPIEWDKHFAMIKEHPWK